MVSMRNEKKNLPELLLTLLHYEQPKLSAIGLKSSLISSSGLFHLQVRRGESC